MKPVKYRSKLVVDGCIPDSFKAGFASAADSIMFENEDHVPPALKPKSRQWIAQFISDRSRLKGKVVQVRVNAVWSEFYHEDLEALVLPGVDIVTLPKV